MGACNWALMQDASVSAPFPPLTCPRHVRTPGWDGGQRMFQYRYSPEIPDASGQCSEALLALE
eukprot:1873954-Alexandrium_andersonii.AAC.1